MKENILLPYASNIIQIFSSNLIHFPNKSKRNSNHRNQFSCWKNLSTFSCFNTVFFLLELLHLQIYYFSTLRQRKMILNCLIMLTSLICYCPQFYYMYLILARLMWYNEDSLYNLIYVLNFKVDWIIWQNLKIVK